MAAKNSGRSGMWRSRNHLSAISVTWRKPTSSKMSLVYQRQTTWRVTILALAVALNSEIAALYLCMAAWQKAWHQQLAYGMAKTVAAAKKRSSSGASASCGGGIFGSMLAGSEAIITLENQHLVSWRRSESSMAQSKRQRQRHHHQRSIWQ